MVVHWVQFVVNFNGEKPSFLEEIEEFSKQLAVCRDVPPLLMGSWQRSHCCRQAPVYVIALLKATMACPDKYMFYGYPKLFDQGDLRCIRTQKSRLQVAIELALIQGSYHSSWPLIEPAGIRIVVLWYIC